VFGCQARREAEQRGMAAKHAANYQANLRNRTLEQRDDEQTSERKQGFAIGSARIRLRDPAAIFGFEVRAWTRRERGEQRRKPGSFGPLHHRILAFEDLQVFGFPDIQRTRTSGEQVIVSFGRKHGLRPLTLAEIVNWSYADMTFRQSWDHISSTLKARRFGFQDFKDTEEMFIEQIERFRAERIVP